MSVHGRTTPGRVVLDQIDSTNAEAARRARRGEAGPLWILGLRQTAGRGRQGRAWVAPPGNLSATWLGRPGLAPAVAAQLSFAAALAVADLLADLSPEGRVALKWPNDALLDNRKVAGVLLESSGTAGRLDWLAIGIGVNLVHAPTDAAPGSHPPGAVAELGGRTVTPEQALDLLAPRLDHWMGRHAAEGFAPLRDAWLGLAARLGEAITVRSPQGPLGGLFEDVDAEGALVLRTAGGIRRISAADVIFPE